MQKLTYDYYNNIEIPTFVLSNIYHHHIGVINNIDTESIQFNFNMNSQQEVSCDVYKELNGEKCELWDKIISLKYIYIPEHEEYYKVDVAVDDGEYTVKHLTLTSAGEYELSNKYITLEINTESDILRNVDDTTNPPYAPNVLYNPNDVDNSILHRVLKDKAPDWSIVHCDESIANIQRTFTISNQKIYDILTSTLAKEYNCLFKFDSVKREIYCYDLYNRCEECGERGEFVYECPQCGSKKIQYGYGKNTNIFITYNNFSEKITLDGDEGAVKNCFRVTGGDDYMNATVRNINPNGSDYIYNFSQNDYDDMPTELVEGLQAYQEKYDELLEPYQEYTEKWYDAINNYYFYKTSMMPRSNGILWEANKGYNLNDETYVKSLATWAYLKCVKAGVSGDEMFDATNASDGQLFEDGTVVWQVVKHIISIPSAEESYNAIVEYFQDNVIYFQREIPSSVTLVNNEIVNMAKLAINNIFKVEVVIDGTNKVVGNTWYGRLKVTNSGNSEDTYKPDSPLAVTIGVYNNLLSYTKYIEDKVVKRINKADTAFINVYDLDYPDVYPYSKDADTVFKALLTQYGLDSLSSFSKSYQSCLDVLIANGIKDKNSTYQDSDYMVWDIYTPIYLPIYGRKELVDEEIERRETTVNRWAQLRDDYRAEMDNIQNQLKLQNFLGDDLFKIFFSYIREDNYNNSNYISTGISDGEVISYAKLLLNTAEKELKKACELQITLSDNIKNLLNTDEFKNYKDNYNIGDYIFVECDGDDWDGGDINNGLYRLRLISASYSFSSPGDINFTFSNATKLNNFFSDAQSIINAAQSINGSYQVVVHQIEKTTNVTDNISDVIDHGFSATNSILANNNNEEVSMGDYGIYAKEYDDITNDYSPKQLRITHNILALTDDNWETTKVAIGDNHYRFYNTDPQRGAIGWTEVDDYGVNANFVQGGYIIGGEIIGTEVVSSNYQVADPSQGIKADGSYINLNDGSFTLAGGGLVGYRNQDGTYYLNYKGDVTGVLDVDVGSTLGVWTVGVDGFYSGTSIVKPDHISVTGNIRANDFFLGTSTTTRLSTILDNKQDLLTAGDYISIDPTTNRISATYSVFTGATSEADGEAGLVKKPLISDRTKFLCGDGTWAVPTGGTTVEPNPVEPATDTLNSIKIDDTVYEISGGDGDVSLHRGIDVPTSDIGDDKDIYLQMESVMDNLLSFDASNQGMAITNYSATETDRKWDITATFINNWEYHSFTVYSLQNLTVGKKYIISFDFQNDGTPPLYGKGELFGLTLQHSSQVIDMRNWASVLVEDGEFKYFEDSYYGEWWYQSFPHDTKRRHYEFEFTARQTTEYIGFYGDRTSGNLTCSLYKLCVGDKVQTNEIKDVYYKLNNQWSLYDRNVTLYHGLETPTRELGDEADIYVQLAPDSNSLHPFSLGGYNGERSNTFTNNNLVYTYKAVYHKDQYNDGRCFGFDAPNYLEAGKTYLVHFDAQSVDGAWNGSGNRNQSRFYGFSYQKQNNFMIHNGSAVEHVANGGFEYLSQFGDGIYYQSFPYDHDKHTFEFSFVATRQGYFVFYGDDFSSGSDYHIEITNFYVVDIDAEGSEINKTYYKLNDEWVENESGKTYEAGDNILIEDNVISGNYQPFEGTDGTEDGASGLVPQPLATDVGKFLKSDGTWAEVQGGGGGSGGAVYREVTLYNAPDRTWRNITLADSLLNYDLVLFHVHDTSYSGSDTNHQHEGALVFTKQELIDCFNDTKIIWLMGYGNTYAMYTLTDYQTLTATAQVTVFIQRITGVKFGSSQVSPIIYSTEEREVGVWTDGKPLYQKTFDCGALLNAQTKEISFTEDMETATIIDAFAMSTSEGYVISLPDIVPNYVAGSVRIYVSKTAKKIYIYSQADMRTYDKSYVTIQYTKTTDVAGSAQYTTLGVPAVHYTTEEQVIGTWTDGKTLYQKTLKSNSGIAQNSWVSIINDSSIRIKNYYGYIYYSANLEDGTKYPLDWTRVANSAFSCTECNGGSLEVVQNVGTSYGYDVTIQYTKTS